MGPDDGGIWSRAPIRFRYARRENRNPSAARTKGVGMGEEQEDGVYRAELVIIDMKDDFDGDWCLFHRRAMLRQFGCPDCLSSPAEQK